MAKTTSVLILHPFIQFFPKTSIEQSCHSLEAFKYLHVRKKHAQIPTKRFAWICHVTSSTLVIDATRLHSNIICAPVWVAASHTHILADGRHEANLPILGYKWFVTCQEEGSLSSDENNLRVTNSLVSTSQLMPSLNTFLEFTGPDFAALDQNQGLHLFLPLPSMLYVFTLHTARQSEGDRMALSSKSP